MNRGRFIVLEGLDGSGKGTQLALLAQALRDQGRQVFVTAEPTQSSTGGMIRDALGGFTSRNAWELSALFLADRIFHNVNPKDGIKKMLSEGVDVICDRYYYSSFAYQGIDADLDWVIGLNLGCSEITKPDLCIFLDADPDACDERISDSRMSREIYENKQTQIRIRNRFLEVFEKLRDKENIRIVDASRSISEVSADIIKICSSMEEF